MKNSSRMNWLKLTSRESDSAEPAILSLFPSMMRSGGLVMLAIVALELIHGRWPSIIYPLAMNPGEAQFAANALRIREHGFNWYALDGSTAGPLDSLILCWPYMFHLVVTFAAAVDDMSLAVAHLRSHLFSMKAPRVHPAVRPVLRGDIPRQSRVDRPAPKLGARSDRCSGSAGAAHGPAVILHIEQVRFRQGASAATATRSGGMIWKGYLGVDGH
jgi:hypothetical protein